MRLGRLSRLWPSKRNRDAASCYRCRTSFVFSRGHLTQAESPLLPGVFVVYPLCGACWRDLSPPERIRYYRQFWLDRRTADPRENELRWAAIEAAVRTGA